MVDPRECGLIWSSPSPCIKLSFGLSIPNPRSITRNLDPLFDNERSSMPRANRGTSGQGESNACKRLILGCFVNFSGLVLLTARTLESTLVLSPKKPGRTSIRRFGAIPRADHVVPGDTRLQDGLNSSRCLARPSGMQALQTEWCCCSRALVRSALTAAPAHGPHPW